MYYTMNFANIAWEIMICTYFDTNIRQFLLSYENEGYCRKESTEYIEVSFMNQTKKLTDGALWTAIFIVLLLITIFVPVISILFIFLLPLPFIIYTYKYNWKAALLMFVVSLLLSLLFATVISLPLTVLAGLGGVMIGHAIHMRLTAYETWARGAVGFIGGLLFVFLISQLLMGVNWTEEIDTLVDESLKTSQAIMEQAGLEQSPEQLEIVENQMNMMKNLLPFGLALSAIVLAFLSQWVSYKFINRLDHKTFQFPPFRDFQLPVALIWIYFGALIISIIEMDMDSTIFMAVQNIIYMCVLFLTLQGFSFIFFYAHLKGVSKAFPIIFVIVSLIFPFFLLYLVRIIGIIDLGFSLRQRLKQK